MQFYQYGGFNFMHVVDSKEFLEQRRATQIQVRRDDVFVTSHPKSGTSWVLHALLTMYDDWGLLELSDRKIAPMPDYFYRIHEPPGILGEAIKKFVATATEIPSPRLFKSHLPPFLFPVDWQKKGCKVIYISRNPKDVCVSSYYFWNAIIAKMGQETEDPDDDAYPPWEQYVQMFANGDIFGPWLPHVVEWKKFGLEHNVLHVTYEDLKKDMKSEFKKMADFLERPLSSEQLDKVVASCSLEEMRKHAVKELDFDDTGYDFKMSDFFRKGKTGNWKDRFTVAQSEMFDEKIGKSLKEAGIGFTYEI
ncbi:sulfotransferase 1 family member D1-like [Glandiceps talaboti]